MRDLRDEQIGFVITASEAGAIFVVVYEETLRFSVCLLIGGFPGNSERLGRGVLCSSAVGLF